MELLVNLWRLIQSVLFARAMHADISDEECIACSATGGDLETLAPNAYRCKACGYEGGSGHATWLEQKRTRKLLDVDEDRRRPLARKKLKEAMRLIVSGRGDISSSQSSGALDLMGIDGQALYGGEGNAKYNIMMTAMRAISEAEQLARDAFILLYGASETNPERVSADAPGFIGAAMDIHFDNMLSDISFLAQTSKLHGQLTKLERAVTQTLSEEFGEPPHQ